jgi:anti-sigma B factor antagonist
VVAPHIPSFEIQLHPHRETIRIAVSGEIDPVTAPQLRNQALELIDGGFDRVILDLRSVTFTDSSGLRAVLDATTRHSNTTSRSGSSTAARP